MDVKYPILGIDVSKMTLDVCLLSEQGGRESLQVRNSPSGFKQLLGWLCKRNALGGMACLESTGVYGAAIALALYKQKMSVCVANPHAVYCFIKAGLTRTKTDRADASWIASFARAMAPGLRAWEPLPEEYQTLRDLVRRYRRLMRKRASIKTEAKNLAYITSDAKTTIQKTIRAELAFYKKQIDEVEEAIQECLHSHDALQQRYDLLTSAPGVGPATAATFMAEVPSIEKFKNAKQLVAFMGLCPYIRHSGTHTPETQPISKVGNSNLRCAFYMASLSARDSNKGITFCTQNAQKKKPMVIQIAVARKLVHQLFAMEKYQRPYDKNYKKQQVLVGTN